MRKCQRCNKRTADGKCPYCGIAICDECLFNVHGPCPEGR